MRRPSLETVVSVAAVAGAVVFVFLQLQPGLLFADTLAAGGDMGAHVWAPAYLRDHLLPHGRITGWTPDWYAGFPALHYYFPLPSLLVVILDVVVPYTIAFKLVTVLGVVSMPVAAYAFGHLTRMAFPTPALLALGTVPFLFDRYHTIWGGNIAATLAGEFSFSIALSLALVYLGIVSHSLRTGRHRALAGVLLAAIGLCHLIPAAFAVAGTGVLFLVNRPGLRRTALVATIGALGFAISGFWLVPFILRLRYSNDMGWERTVAYIENLAPFLRDDAAGVTTAHLKLVIPIALVGVGVALARRDRGAIALVVLAAICGLGFRFLPAGPIWNARLLPFWYLMLYFLAAVAVGQAASLFRQRLPALLTPAVVLVAVLLVVGIPLGAIPRWTGISSADHSFVPDWAKWNYSGYERKDAWPEYQGVVETMADVGREHGCGRAMWEYESELNRYGTPMALMLLPYWTDGCIGSMEGLFFESSATVPYHFLNQSELSKAPSRAMRDLPYRGLDVAAGVEHLQLLGVRYYMALTSEAQAQASTNPDLSLVATTPVVPVTYGSEVKDRSWQIYVVHGAELVEGLRVEPERGPDLGKEEWLARAVRSYQADDPMSELRSAGGPASWEEPDLVRKARVSGIRATDDRISFDVDRPGTPVLVKASYFPNWTATGADGPWRVTPNLMVVVPHARHVELRYGWTGVDVLGWILTFVGLVGAVVLARRRPATLPEEPSPPSEDYVDPFALEPEPAMALPNAVP